MATVSRPDPYSWWVGRQVHVRVAAPSDWRPAQVTEARHSVLYGLDNEEFWYDAEFGEADGHAEVFVLEHGSQPIREGVFPGGPHGVLPNVVLSYTWGKALQEWWTGLRPETRRALLLQPGVAPPETIADVAVSGAVTTGAFWPSAQPGPSEFRLGVERTALVQDIALVRAYESAQDDYDRTFKDVDLSSGLFGGGMGPLNYEQAKAVIKRRNNAKLELDAHRLVLNGL